MARRKRNARVLGPYADRRGWRIIIYDGSGERHSRIHRGDEAQARELVRELKAALGERGTVAIAVDRYLDWREQSGVKAVTIATARYRLDKLLDPVAYDLVEDLTPAKAAELYTTMTESGCSVDYHQNALSEARRFGRRLVERGVLRLNPFADVEPVGQKNAGKPQLRVDEARKLLRACLAESTEESLAVLLALLLGPRAGEVAGLKLRDVDDEGRLLWIDTSGTKTRSARRYLEVPTLIRPMLVAHKTSRLPSAPKVQRHEPDGVRLFPGRTRYWVYWHVKRLCGVAGVPPVSAQALRGSHATFATAAGATGELVQAALGHASVAVGDRHYTDASVKASTRSNRAQLRVISGGRR